MTIRGINRVMLIGEIDADPDLRYTPDGTSVASFPVATRQRWRTSTGEARDVEEWFHVVAWGDLAERCTEELAAGDVLYVEGRLQTRSWEDEQGRQHFMAEVAAQEVLQLSNGVADGPDEVAAALSAGEAAKETAVVAPSVEGDDDLAADNPTDNQTANPTDNPTDNEE